MTIIRWKHRPMFSDLFDDMLEKRHAQGLGKDCGCIPATNIVEKDNEFEIQLAVPGMKKEDFRLEMEQNTLSVVYESKEEEQREGEEFLQREYHMHDFTRSFSIPETAEAEKIKARYDSGILHITVPKKDKEKARLSKQIKIS